MEHQPESPAAKLQLLARSIEGIVTQIRRRTARREPQFETAPIGAKQEFPDDHESVRLRKLSRSIAHIAEQVKRKNASRAGPAIVEPENRDTENFAGELTRPSEFDTLSDLLEEIVKDSRRAEIPESKPRAAPSAETTDPDRFEQRIRELHAMAQSLTMQSSAANHNDPAFSGSSKKRSSARNDGSEIERQKPSGFDDEWTNEPENPVENSRDAARATDTGRRYENDPQVATIARFPRSRSDERSEPSRRVHGESRSGYADPEPAQHRYAPAQQFPQPHFAQPQPVYFPPAQPGPPLQPCAPAPGPYGQPWSAQPVWQSYPMPVQQPPFHPQPMVAPQYYIWPQHPSPAYPAHPGYAPDQAPYVRPESAPPPDQPGRYHTDPVTRAQFEEIKESLREFQGALYDLSDQRTLRRA